MASRALFKSFVAALLALATAAASPAATTPCYGTAEIALSSTSSFNAAQGSPNPFDFDVLADVTSPSGRKITARGFFDGDGAGGAQGNVFKIRLYADEIGIWSWSVRSNAPGLAGRSGSFAVSGRLAGTFGHGPVVVSPSYPRTFMYRDGTPVFLAGKFLDAAAPDPIKYSHTLWSEKLTDADRQAMLARHLGMKVNKMNVYVANRGDYGGGVPTTPWVGTAAANDKTRFDLARWRMFDQWMAKLRDAGIAAELWFFADDSQFGSLSIPDRDRLMRYAMARLSGYVNTMFILCLEWQEGWTTSQVATDADYIHANNPWARLVSVHGWTGNFAFPTASWADYMDIQGGNSVSPAALNRNALANRSFAVKPVLEEEHGLGQEDTLHRQRAWAAFTGGAAGIGTGGSLPPLVQFTQRVRFERMNPDNALVLAGTAWALAERGNAYVFYLPYGGTVKVDLHDAAGVFTAEWYDPRTGAASAAGVAAGGTTPGFTAPAAGDWMLYLHR